MQNCKEELKKLNNPNILMSKMYSFDEVRQLLEQQRSEVLKIITEEIALTHFGKRGKTSGLTSAWNLIKEL